jgi:hypothetical protein
MKHEVEFVGRENRLVMTSLGFFFFFFFESEFIFRIAYDVVQGRSHSYYALCLGVCVRESKGQRELAICSKKGARCVVVVNMLRQG